jgi:glycosyltransferase involved in cell wall biosynthesis
MRLTLVSPDHPIYEEMVDLLRDRVDFAIVGDRFRQGRRTSLPPASRSVIAKAISTCRRTPTGTMAYQLLKTSILRRDAEAGSAHVCGGIWNGRTAWIGDYENVNVLSFYDPSILRSASYQSFLVRQFQRAECRAIRVWSNFARRSFEAVFSEPEIVAKVRVIRPTLSAVPQLVSKNHTGPPRVLFVGRGFYVKGGLILLQAVQLLRDRGIRLVLDFVGDIPDEARHLVGQLGAAVEVTPPQLSRGQLMRDHLQRADVFVMLGMADSYGLAVVEAMSCGLPVLAFRLNSGLTELVGPTGAGILVEPGDQIFGSDGVHVCSAADLERRLRSKPDPLTVEAVAQSLSSLVEDGGLRQKLGSRGRSTVVEGILSSQDGRAALLNLYRETLGY